MTGFSSVTHTDQGVMSMNIISIAAALKDYELSQTSLCSLVVESVNESLPPGYKSIECTTTGDELLEIYSEMSRSEKNIFRKKTILSITEYLLMLKELEAVYNGDKVEKDKRRNGVNSFIFVFISIILTISLMSFYNYEMVDGKIDINVLQDFLSSLTNLMKSK